jgi:glyoxylase I family protein
MTTGPDRKAVIAAVESYIHGLGGRDLSQARLAPDVVYESPISPGRHGSEDVITFLSGLFPVLTGVRIIDHAVDGSVCATRFDLETTGGTVHVFDRFEIRDGMVTRINPYYDPAPLLAALAPLSSGSITAEPTVSGVHHVAFTVSDAERSAAWYRALLGLSEVMRSDDEEVSVRVLGSDVLMIGLRQYHRMAADAFDELRTGLDHLAFAVRSEAELKSWEGRLRDRRIPFSPIAETPIGSVLVFRDPDNIQLELWLPATS